MIRKAVAATFSDSEFRKISFILIVKNMLAKTKPNALYFLIISVCYLFQYYRSGLIYPFVNKSHAVSVKLSENHHQKYLPVLRLFRHTFLKELTSICISPPYTGKQVSE